MNFVLAAGGTGGHMIPAHALAAELKGRGHGVLLITDERGARFPGLFEGVPVSILPAGRLGGGPIRWLKALPRSSRAGARRRSSTAISTRRVVGFGGYPAFPSLLAASSMSIPTVLHEQNAVLGRVNRLLAGDAVAIGTAYDEVERLKPRYADKVVLVGNPVREEIVRLGELPFPPFDELRAAQDPRHGRKPGRDRPRATWSPRASACSTRRSAAGCRSSSNAGPRISSGSASTMPISASRPSS